MVAHTLNLSTWKIGGTLGVWSQLPMPRECPSREDCTARPGQKAFSFICFTHSSISKCHYFLSLRKKNTKTHKQQQHTLSETPTEEENEWASIKQSCDHGLVELTSLGLSQTCKPMDDLLPELLKQPGNDIWCHSPKSPSPLIWLLLVTNMRNVLTALIMWPCKWSQTWEQSGPGSLDLKLTVSNMLGIFYPWFLSLSLYVYPSMCIGWCKYLWLHVCACKWGVCGSKHACVCMCLHVHAWSMLIPSSLKKSQFPMPESLKFFFLLKSKEKLSLTSKA